MFAPIALALILIILALTHRKPSPSAYKESEPITMEIGEIEEFEAQYLKQLSDCYVISFDADDDSET